MLLEHDNTGSLGMILNKQSTLCLLDALPELETGLPLYYGGPFCNGSISYIHDCAGIPEAVPMGNDIFLNGDYDCMKEMILSKKMKPGKIRFFSGLVHWSAGELEWEANENKWWTGKISAQELFTASPEELWSYELISHGHVYGLLNEFPDPCMS